MTYWMISYNELVLFLTPFLPSEFVIPVFLRVVLIVRISLGVLSCIVHESLYLGTARYKQIQELTRCSYSTHDKTILV